MQVGQDAVNRTGERSSPSPPHPPSISAPTTPFNNHRAYISPSNTPPPSPILPTSLKQSQEQLKVPVSFLIVLHSPSPPLFLPCPPLCALPSSSSLPPSLPLLLIYFFQVGGETTELDLDELRVLTGALRTMLSEVGLRRGERDRKEREEKGERSERWKE